MGCSNCGKTKSLSNTFRQVINGVDHYFKDENGELFVERYKHCLTCPDATVHKLFCGHCKCILQAKLRLEEERCPIGKWEAVNHVA